MSLTFEEGLAGSGRHFLTRIAAGLLAAHDRQRRYFAIRRTRRKLHELPDWILRDIGINRGEIDGLSARVHEPYQNGGDRSWRFLL